MYKVYVLYSHSFNKIYVGQTVDLEKRLFEHNNGLLSNYTKRYKPWEVVYTEEYPTRSEALKREKQLKSQREESSFGNSLMKNTNHSCKFDPLANGLLAEPIKPQKKSGAFLVFELTTNKS